MPIPNTISLTGPIAPTSLNDVYPTHFSIFGKGGHREVDTLQDRNRIPEERRSLGMTVYVISENTIFILIDGITNQYWVPLGDFLNIGSGGSGGSGGSIYVSDGATPTNPTNKDVWLNRSNGVLYYRNFENTIWIDSKTISSPEVIDFGTF